MENFSSSILFFLLPAPKKGDETNNAERKYFFHFSFCSADGSQDVKLLAECNSTLRKQENLWKAKFYHTN